MSMFFTEYILFVLGSQWITSCSSYSLKSNFIYEVDDSELLEELSLQLQSSIGSNSTVFGCIEYSHTFVDMSILDLLKVIFSYLSRLSCSAFNGRLQLFFPLFKILNWSSVGGGRLKCLFQS